MGATPRLKFLGCIPVEVGALILGYLQTHVAGVAILVGVSYFGAIFYQFFVDYSALRRGIDRLDVGFCFLSLSFAILSFIMAIFLIIGVNKRQSSFVLAYFMSGLISAVGFALLWAKLVCVKSYHFTDDVPLSLFISFFVYLPFLWMVFSSYENIRHENDLNDTLRENSAENLINNVYHGFLHKRPSDNFKITDNVANDTKVDIPHDTPWKDFADDVKNGIKDTSPKGYGDDNKENATRNATQKYSTNHIGKSISYSTLREDVAEGVTDTT